MALSQTSVQNSSFLRLFKFNRLYKPTACDRVRDETLVALGVQLEDRPDGPSVWKLDDPEALLAEQKAKKERQQREAAKKLQNILATKLKEKERAERAMLPPAKYSQFDPETGDPTHDKDGNLLEGKAKDKAKKEMDKIRKTRAPIEKKLQEDPEYLVKLDAEIDGLTTQLKALEVVGE